MSQQTFEYNVKMTCSGCSNAVNKALTKTEGVEKVDIDMDKQKVTVTAADGVAEETVFKAIEKTGKAVTRHAA